MKNDERVPTKVQWDARTKPCFEDTKAYPSHHQSSLIGRSGLRV